MPKHRHKKKHYLGKGAAIVFVLVAAFTYLAHEALTGNSGLIALMQEKYKKELIKAELAEVSKRRAELEHRVSLMKDESLDADMLEEQARRFLGITYEDEVVIIGSLEEEQ